MPSSRSTEVWVVGWFHMRVFMAGATRNGLVKSWVRNRLPSRSSATPAAILLSRLAVAGHRSVRSAHRGSSMCSIQRPASNVSLTTALPDRPSKVAAPTNASALGDTAQRTS